VLTADAHVERGRQHAGAAVRETVDHADGRLGAGANLVEPACALGAERVELGLRVLLVVLALLVDVAAGRERLLAGAGDDDASDRRVGDGRGHRRVQLGGQLTVERVELVGAVEREDRDAVDGLGEQVVRHGAV
jgi:hypothetical protein